LLLILVQPVFHLLDDELSLSLLRVEDLGDHEREHDFSLVRVDLVEVRVSAAVLDLGVRGDVTTIHLAVRLSRAHERTTAINVDERPV